MRNTVRPLFVLSLAATVTLPALADGNPTIDRLLTAPFGGYEQTYDPTYPWTSFQLFGFTSRYELNDGSSWESGAGSQMNYQASAPTATVVGDRVRYAFDVAPGTVMLDHTDYSFGDHSAQGTLAAASPMVMVAKLGSTTAVLRGAVKVTSNTETWYGLPLFNYYSAQVGDVVRFTSTYTLSSGSFTADLFDASFYYNQRGVVDFTATVPEPAQYLTFALGLGVLALRQRRSSRVQRQRGAATAA